MGKTDYRILLVEDEEYMASTIKYVLGGQYNLRHAPTLADAREAMRREQPDLLLLDLGLPDGSGVELLRGVRQHDGNLDVIVITGCKDVGVAVEAMKLGARDYVPKPFEREDLLLSLDQAFETWSLRSNLNRLEEELYAPFTFGNIVAKSPRMTSVFDLAKKMSQSEANVLITGEGGTGKELIARAIHSEGTRRHGPFVAFNCAASPETLLESELFGFERGAFSGAEAPRKGRFELAHGGTLFLDEIGNASLEMQAKVLRAVETRQFERLGGETTITVDARVISATNTDLRKEVEQGHFREDLYYRLNVVRIEVPPLRERPEDIEPLCDHFLQRHHTKTGQPLRRITKEAMDTLRGYRWPGNVRELQNLIEMTVALEEGEWITTRYLPDHVLANVLEEKTPHAETRRNLLESVVENFEKRYLTEQLRINGWRSRAAARALGVHRNTIENKIRKFGIKRERPDSD